MVFELSAERLAEIEADLDDDSGYLVKSSTLKHIIEQEVRRALGQRGRAVGQNDFVFLVLLRHLMTEGCYARVIWKSCQWEATADEDIGKQTEELIRMYDDHGIPGSIEFVLLD